MNKNDLRYIKTHELIRETFISSVEEYGFQHTSISLICEKARINRTTFYLHYQDKYALLEEFNQEIKDSLSLRFEKESKMDSSYYDLENSCRFCVEEISSHRRIIKLLLKEARPLITQTLKEVIVIEPSKKMNSRFEEFNKDIIFRINFAYMFNAMIGFYEEWFEDFEQLSIPKAAKLMYELCVMPSKKYLDNLFSK